VIEDLNVDMEVNIQDLLILIAAWGNCPEGIDTDTTGACCLNQFMCEDWNEIACIVSNGTYFGDNTTCNEVDCPVTP
jgi:hypothetical protein